jgi:hypothetical protein
LVSEVLVSEKLLLIGFRPAIDVLQTMARQRYARAGFSCQPYGPGCARSR